MRRWWIGLAYVILLIVGMTNKDYLLEWLRTSDPSWLPAMFLLSVLIASIPFLPFTLFAGIMGVKFGAMVGLLINWFGILLTSLIYFFYQDTISGIISPPTWESIKPLINFSTCSKIMHLWQFCLAE